jgi:predicted nucleotidyltransferase
MTNKDREVARKLAEKLRKAATRSVKRIILFGSCATGKTTVESDYGFLVIEADPVSKRDEMNRLRQAVSGSPYLFDTWVMGEEEFEETKGVIGGLAYPVHKYGAVIYEYT